MTGSRRRRPSIVVRAIAARAGGWAAAGSLLLTALAAGCGSAGFRAPVPLHAAPEPAVSPPPTATPAGRLVPTGPGPEGIAVTSDGTIAVAVRGPHPGLDLFDGATGARRRFVALDGEARHLGLAGPAGPVLVPVETADRLEAVDAASGRVTGTVAVGRQPHDAAAIGATWAVADEFGNSVHFIRDGAVTAVTAAPLQPGGITAAGGAFAVVGVRARVLAAYRPDGTLLARAACGAGPTHVVAGPDGWLYVADTLGGDLLAFHLSGTALQLRARIHTGFRPYGLAADPDRGWVYVTLTGSDQLLGLRMVGARVVQRRVWPTGRQPNSVAVDTRDGLVAVTVSGSDQLELIGAPAG